MEIAAGWEGDDDGHDDDDDDHVHYDDHDHNHDDDDDDDDIGREFFSPAPISRTGNYWPR